MVAGVLLLGTSGETGTPFGMASAGKSSNSPAAVLRAAVDVSIF